MPSVIPRQHIANHIQGRTVVDEDEVKRRLGATAYRVWCALAKCRNKVGATHITINGIASCKGMEPISTYSVRAGLRRLREVGLVEDLSPSRMLGEVPRRGSDTPVKAFIFPRVVYGVRGVEIGKPTMSFVAPKPIIDRIMKMPGWGGARNGAGHPRSKPVLEPRERDPRLVEYLGYLKREVSRVHVLDKPGGTPIPVTLISTNRSDINLIIPVADKCANVAPRGAVAFKSHPISLSSHTPDIVSKDYKDSTVFDFVKDTAVKSPAVAIPTKTPKAGHHTAPSQGDVETSVGFKLGGNAVNGGRVPRPGVDPGVPRHPSELLKPAIIPSPPQIPDGLSDMDAAMWLVRTYRGVVKSVTKKECWVLATRQQLAKSKYLKTLASAARMMREMEIPPAAWAMFSMDVWRKFGKGKASMPPIAWMFSEKRMADREGWFRHEEGGYHDSRIIYGDAAQDIMRRWAGMYGALVRALSTGGDLSAVVGRFFPDGMYDKLIDRANREAADDQLVLNKAMVRGDWIW